MERAWKMIFWGTSSYRFVQPHAADLKLEMTLVEGGTCCDHRWSFQLNTLHYTEVEIRVSAKGS